MGNSCSIVRELGEEGLGQQCRLLAVESTRLEQLSLAPDPLLPTEFPQEPTPHVGKSRDLRSPLLKTSVPVAFLADRHLQAQQSESEISWGP